MWHRPLSYCPALFREEVLATLAAVSDFSYAWGIIDVYTPVLQAQVCSTSTAHSCNVSVSYMRPVVKARCTELGRDHTCLTCRLHGL